MVSIGEDFAEAQEDRLPAHLRARGRNCIVRVG